MFAVIRTLFNLLRASRTNTPRHFIVVRQWARKRKPLNPFTERSEKSEAPTVITADTGGARSKRLALLDSQRISIHSYYQYNGSLCSTHVGMMSTNSA